MAKFRSTHPTRLVDELKNPSASKDARGSGKPRFNAEWMSKPPDDYRRLYKRLARDFRRGVVPAEWEEIYEKLRAVIYDGLSDGSTNYTERVAVTYEFFRKYFYDIHPKRGTPGFYAPGRFLNGYLTRRLRSEGFRRACIRLVRELGNPWADSMNASLDASYKRELADWNARKQRYNIAYAESNFDVPKPGAAPKAPTHYSKTESISYFYVSCGYKRGDWFARSAIKNAEYHENEWTGRAPIR